MRLRRTAPRVPLFGTAMREPGRPLVRMARAPRRSLPAQAAAPAAAHRPDLALFHLEQWA